MTDFYPDNQSPDEKLRTDFIGSFDTEEDDLAGLSTLYCPQPQTAPTVRLDDIADMLFDIDIISEDQLKHIRQKQSENKILDIEQIILETGLADDTDILKAKAKQFGYQFIKINPEQIDKEVFARLDIDYIKSNSIIPLHIEDNNLIAATCEPENVFAIDDVKRIFAINIIVKVCPAEDIRKACEFFENQSEEQPFDYCVDEIINDMAEVEIVQDEQTEAEDLEKIAGESPVIKFVNYLISNAIRQSASDIHIEPKKTESKIRYRIDGVLFDAMAPPAKMHSAIVSRLKIMSNLDISERRLPQDGKITVIVGKRNIDLRVSTLPITHGEKVVIRILDSKSILRGLDNSGMQPDVMQTFRQQIALPNGIVLVTGPTGSGKSTTLYSAIKELNGTEMNISTVEDPVEYELDFANQVNTREKIGLTFAAALRSLLRQDPDIIMVGEIRDNETARIAVQAALTGHLVLSTLHTNDAPSTITRLINIGIDPYLIAASLNAVLAQRLVRTICTKCKTEYQIPENLKKFLSSFDIEPGTVYHGSGCDSCRNSGYSGRIGIYELMVIDENIRSTINKDHSVSSMRRAFKKTKSKTLFLDGMEKVRQGITTIEEVLRVTEISEPETETDNTAPKEFDQKV